MKSLVVYDSVFGNTKLIAETIAKVIGDDATLEHVSQASANISDINLLIVGSPTRAFNCTPAMTTYLRSIPAHKLDNIRCAAFDTRADVNTVNNKFLSFMVKRFGYANEKIEKLLRSKGGVL